MNNRQRHAGDPGQEALELRGRGRLRRGRLAGEEYPVIGFALLNQRGVRL